MTNCSLDEKWRQRFRFRLRRGKDRYYLTAIFLACNVLRNNGRRPSWESGSQEKLPGMEEIWRISDLNFKIMIRRRGSMDLVYRGRNKRKNWNGKNRVGSDCGVK
jgi:hypothetical protein